MPARLDPSYLSKGQLAGAGNLISGNGTAHIANFDNGLAIVFDLNGGRFRSQTHEDIRADGRFDFYMYHIAFFVRMGEFDGVVVRMGRHGHANG